MDGISIKKRKKSSAMADSSMNNKKSSVQQKDLICIVCGAAATGFNFGIITCMCCKAFFRRNALLGLHSLQCRYLRENCIINSKSRRDCSYCRLKKCFDVGMKKELILTEELKRVKREKILANRQMTLNSMRAIDSLDLQSNFQLKAIDLSYLTNIYNAYDEYCLEPLIKFEKTEYDALCQQPIKSRIKIQHYYEYFAKSQSFIIDFFRRIPEFKQLSDNEQMALSRHNMRFIMRINLIESLNDQLPLWPAINLLLESIFGKILMEETTHLLHQFKDQINDSTCIRLLLIILLFSTYTTYTGQTDVLHIYQIQAKYTELLWLYLTQRYSEYTACRNFSLIIRHCLRMQTIGHLADLKREEVQQQTVFLSLSD